MTTQDRISLLATAAVDTNRNPGAPPGRSPWAPAATPRKTQVQAQPRVLQARISNAFSEAPARAFIPFIYTGEGAAREMFAKRKARPNRRRGLHRPSLARAIVCLVASLCALFATSTEGEARITSWVPAIKKTMDRAEVVVLETFGPDRGMREVSLNSEDFR